MKQRPLTSPLVIVLTFCTILSLATQIVTLMELNRVRNQARSELSVLSAQLTQLRTTQIELEIPIRRTVPVSAQVPINQALTVPINTTIRVDTTVNIPITTPFGSTQLPVPVQGDFPINTEVPVLIDFDVPIATDVELAFDLPVTIPLAETSFDALLAELAARLALLSDDL